MGRSVDVVFLGTSGAVPSRERFLSGILVRDWHGNTILLDAGEGVQLRLRQAGYSPTDIDWVLVTHSHGDHVNGLAGLIQSMHVLGRREPLHIIGPETVTRFVLETLEVDKRRLGFQVYTTPISWGTIRGATVLYEHGGDKLLAGWYKTCHTPDSYGFLLEWALRVRLDKDKLSALPRDRARRAVEALLMTRPATRLRISYTGDTLPCENVVESSMGADLLIHDSSFSVEEEDAHEKGHSTALDAASAASLAGVGLLVLTHISTRYSGYEARRLLLEARRVFPRSILAYDLMRLRLEAPILVADPARILDALSQLEGQASR
ncbi:MAG: MBL fold metallo-hydrolase [Desulfurococcales archaeon]|nr:MBL fold metallo-hydrolase [Desulfurococcales archaeon]